MCDLKKTCEQRVETYAIFLSLLLMVQKIIAPYLRFVSEIRQVETFFRMCVLKGKSQKVQIE